MILLIMYSIWLIKFLIRGAPWSLCGSDTKWNTCHQMHKFEAYFPNQPPMKYVPLYVQFEF